MSKHRSITPLESKEETQSNMEQMQKQMITQLKQQYDTIVAQKIFNNFYAVITKEEVSFVCV